MSFLFNGMNKTIFEGNAINMGSINGTPT